MWLRALYQTSMESEPSEESELKSSPKAESFTSLILRTLPTCWRRVRAEEGESDDGGFRDHHLRTKRAQLAQSDQFSSLQAQPRYFRTDQRLSPLYSSPDRPADRRRIILRKTGGRSGRYSVSGRERELRHYNSCHTFSPSTPSTTSITGGRGRPQGLVVYRRPHSVDLGGVGRAGVRQSRAQLSDEFRRVGIGTCLEGGLVSLV